MTEGLMQVSSLLCSGKSTLLSNLRQFYKDDDTVVFLKEPVDEWDTIVGADGRAMLQKFYADPVKYAFPFQMMAYISRLAVLKNAIKENPQATLFISERSLFTDKFVFAKMLFDMGKIEDVCYQIYCKWFDAFALDCPIEQIIYVATDPEICHKRTMSRARVGEEGIPLDYLTECHKYHEKMMFSEVQQYVSAPQLKLNGNTDIYEHKNTMQEWQDQVATFVGHCPTTSNNRV
jgi:deoxyadenosine/deoxycytidine kinase